MFEPFMNSTVDIEFQRLKYVITGTSKKDILKSINGKFCCGELTGILGTSGAGKSTLLNVLAGYISTGVSGSITVNGNPRDMKTFRKLTAYIMQDDLLQPFLSVKELMTMAAKLKLGDNVSMEEKLATINEALTLMGLENCAETRTENLSGGQKRRLSVALEMVSNPPVIFLDEPTSGLDTVSANQCLNNLRNLARQGKTVICTIHQPSSSMLNQFNQVYFLHDGMCVYNGTTSNIIPFMSSLGLECPVTYCPAEYLVDTVDTSPEKVLLLSDTIQNGKMNRRNRFLERLQSFNGEEPVYENVTSIEFPTSFWSQFIILCHRMFLQIKRNKTALWIQVANHLLGIALFASLYYGIGNDAKKTFFIFNYCAGVLTFFLYTYTMIPVVSYPTELQLLRREHFNGWYDLKPYFLALTLRSLPIMVVFGLAFLSITYVLTGQPLELYRFVWFATVCILVGVVSEGLGVIIGSTFNLTNGAVVAPSISAALLLFCVHGIGYGGQVNWFTKIFLNISYLRVAMVVMCNVLFGNRDYMDCDDEFYCYYEKPDKFLNDLGMENSYYCLNVLGLVGFFVIFRMCGFLALKFRLTYEFTQTILNYANKILRHR